MGIQHGRVAVVNVTKRVGSIKADTGVTFAFHFRAVTNAEGDRLAVNQRVRFSPASNTARPVARSVRVE